MDYYFATIPGKQETRCAVSPRFQEQLGALTPEAALVLLVLLTYCDGATLPTISSHLAIGEEAVTIALDWLIKLELVQQERYLSRGKYSLVSLNITPAVSLAMQLEQAGLSVSDTEYFLANWPEEKLKAALPILIARKPDKPRAYFEAILKSHG
jgi:hypothetical protein